MKYYGVYTAYPPTVDLRTEGLGRYLAAFLKAAAERNDVRFVVACPSWSKKSLLELCESEGVDTLSFDLVYPPRKPIVLRIFETYQAYISKPRGLKWFAASLAWSSSKVISHRRWVEEQVVNSRTLLSFLPLIAYLLLIFVLALPFIAIYFSARPVVRSLFNRFRIPRTIAGLMATRRELLRSPKDSRFAVRLYALMEKRESEWLVNYINRLTHVSAWYSPAAFWPAFNSIAFPRLMCIPDVVLTDFPVGFACSGGGDRLLNSFENLKKAIKGGCNFVTYSEHVKWNTVVDRYGSSPDSVHVVRHAPNLLNNLITVSGFHDAKEASENYCRSIFRGALLKSNNINYVSGFANSSVQFIFYASQFRPNKNVLNLLRAYEYLLRARFISHKLVLTGNIHTDEVTKFIGQNNLANDVLCLHGLTNSELAACYRLADLAVNPSLSEGGCPFTFTEALSVGTPAVMARIPVSMEILNDPAMANTMFFDPYNWRDIADRIEWGLDNQTRLLDLQRPVYDRLALRSWGDVVSEHIEILDNLAQKHLPESGMRID